MLDKPNPNPGEPKREIPPAPPEPRTVLPGSVGGDHIVIQGSVGSGANVGSGSVTADQIAGGDITIINNGGGKAANSPQQFVEMLGDLRTMLEQAKEEGELDPLLAGQAIKNLNSAEELITKDQKPPKPEILKRLEAVAQMIDAAVDMLTQDGSVGSILLKALPVAVALIKVASHLF